jgi:hypothetical protein
MNEYTEAANKWREQTDAMAERGYWARFGEAQHFFGRHIAPIWRQHLGLAGADTTSHDDVVKLLKLTPNCILLIHLFARGYSRVAASKKTPVFACWPPMKAGKELRFVHAIPKRDLARMTGVAWSRTERGGRQLPLLAPPPEGGCFRWGMCEAPTTGDK